MATPFLFYFRSWLYPTLSKKIFLFTLIIFLLILSTMIVYWAGGTHIAFTHLFYFPIILSGFIFSIPGGIISGLVAGLLLGPWMPSDMALSLLQPTFSWVIRCFFFIFVGGFAGLSSAIFRSYIRELEFKFTIHPLTALPNLHGLEAFFKKLSFNQPAKIVVIEIRNLTHIERAIGEAGAEDLIRQIGQFLSKSAEKTGQLGHIDNSTFAIIFSDLKHFKDFFTFKKPDIPLSYSIREIPIFVEFYYGVSEFPGDHRELLHLIRQARIAIESSVHDKKPIGIYQSHQDQMQEKNIKLLYELHTRLGKTNEFYLAYQPKVDLSSGKIIGVEALVRWQHKMFGAISPTDFIPLIENTLLIHPFTAWVVEQSLKDLTEWQKQGVHTTIAINFSIYNFQSKDLLSQIISLVEQYKIMPQNLQIEVTESSSTYEMNQVAVGLDYFRKKGMKVWIDDFGTGQASLQYLFSLPIDGLKICSDFTKQLGVSDAANAILKSTILLAHDLNLQVVVEGIETKEQYQKLKEIGCDIGQGYYFSKPLLSSEISKLFLSQDSKIIF